MVVPALVRSYFCVLARRFAKAVGVTWLRDSGVESLRTSFESGTGGVVARASAGARAASVGTKQIVVPILARPSNGCCPSKLNSMVGQGQNHLAVAGGYEVELAC